MKVINKKVRGREGKEVVIGSPGREKGSKTGKVIRLGETDILMLEILYKVTWAHDYHIAILIDEPVSYVKGRLKQFEKKCLIERVSIAAGAPACNYITQSGIKALGKERRNVRVPGHGRYDHDLGEINVYVWLAICGLATFGEVITERDFASVREMETVGIRSDGQEKRVRVDRDLHFPDGFIEKEGEVIAIEYERSKKTETSKSQLDQNIKDLTLRFTTQYWVCETEVIARAIHEVAEELGLRDNVKLIHAEKVKRDIKEAIKNLPEIQSKKEGRKRKNLIGNFKNPKPIGKLTNLARKISFNEA